MPTVTLRVSLDAELPNGTFRQWTPNMGVDHGDFGAPTVGHGVLAFATNKKESYFPHDDGVTLPAAAIISSVSIDCFKTDAVGTAGSLKLFFYSGGSTQEEAAAFGGTGAHSYALALNPFTVAAWTRAHVFAKQVGVHSVTIGSGGLLDAVSTAGTYGLAISVTYTAPGLTSLAPASGPMVGGTTVTLVGVGFGSGGLTAVTFDGVAATGIVVLSDVLATCVTPAGRVATVDVVATISGTPYTLAASYTYIVSPPRLTADGTLALPVLDAAAMADPSRATIALRDAFTALSRTMQEFAFLISTALTNVKWVANPYTSVNFTVESPDGGIWTVEAADQLEFDYVRLGDILFMQIRLTATSTLAGKTYTSLYIKIPGGYRTQGGVRHVGHAIIDQGGSGTEELALVEVDGTGGAQPVDKLRIRRLPTGTNFAAGIVNLLDVRLCIQFRIVPPPTAQ